MSLIFDDLQNQMKQITSVSEKQVKKEINVKNVPDVDMIEEEFDNVEEVIVPDTDISDDESYDYDSEDNISDDLDKY